MENLIESLRSSGLIVNGHETLIVLERYEDGQVRQAVDVETFRGFFEAALDAAGPGEEYEALLTADANADGTAKGYARFFQAWHSVGIV